MPENQAEIDPFVRAERLRDAYLGYLRDALPIHPDQRRLRELFDQQVMEGFGFVKEPLLSATPRFRPDVTLRQLIAEGLLSERMLSLDAGRLPPNRPLYTHQAQAIRQIAARRNTIVATGTGSGKTECFLLPVLSDALENPGSGVRTLLIYPMNALANDQLLRLRELVGDSGIRFGRYTGETRQTEAELDDPGPNGCPSEARSREAIRDDPPQLLLSNFAMLEYLLLRPDDQSIFASDSLTTVVLDEAHAYNGVQGIDVGLLMRRLQQRYPHRLRFVLTSATLGDDSPEGNQAVAGFAERLTGGAFSSADLIRGEPIDPFVGRDERVELPPAAAEIADEPDAGASAVADWVERFGAACVNGEENPDAAAFGRLRRDPVTATIFEALSAEPRTVSGLAEAVGASMDTVRNRLRLAFAVHDPATDLPIVSLRMHQWFRGLHGVSVSLAADDHGSGPGVAQLRIEQASVEDAEASQVFYPLLCCSACGTPAIDAALPGSRCVPRTKQTRDEDARVLSWVSPEVDDESEDADETDGSGNRVWVHTGDGRYATEPPSRMAGWVGLWRLDADGEVKKCSRCGSARGRFPSVFRSFRTGEDGPTAVLAEAMLADIRGCAPSQPGGGRQLLAFSDSRQKAAYFAPYLNRTMRDVAEVQPLVEAAARLAAEDDEPAVVDEVLGRALRIAKRQPYVVMPGAGGLQKLVQTDELTPQSTRVLKKSMATTLFRHLCSTPAQRLRLPSLRLAYPGFFLTGPEVRHFNEQVGLLIEDSEIRADFRSRLLLLMLRRAAVDLPGDLTPMLVKGLERGPDSSAFHLSQGGTARGAVTHRFNPYHADGSSRNATISRSRTVPIAREALGSSADADRCSQLLDAAWAGLRRPEAGEDALLVPRSNDGSFRINPDRILVHTRAPWFQCERCGAVTRHRMRGGCPVFACIGTLRDFADISGKAVRMHERYSTPPLLADAKEHTAQLTNDRGRVIQQEFIDGRVNVLSCSTTFEMGIDVGNLDAVLLRNVPPSAANYVQRVGRAGRRRQAIAHAAVYAAARPHDQYFYHQPEKIAAGRVEVPRIWLRNCVLFQRHVNSFLLGRFWSESGLDPRMVAVQPADQDGDLIGFMPASAAVRDSGAQRFAVWCRANADQLAAEIARFKPEAIEESPGFFLAGSATRLLPAALLPDDASEAEPGVGSADICQTSVWPRLRSWNEQIAELRERQKAFGDEGEYQKAGRLQGAEMSVQRLIEEYQSQRLLDLLSFEHWLPNFAFPQDTTRLRVVADDKEKVLRLERPRSRAIAEYAPGAEVIVDGESVRAAGLDLLEREPNLRLIEIDERTQIVTDHGTLVRDSRPGKNQTVVFQPRGFVTAYGVRPEPPNVFRELPKPVSPAYLVGGSTADRFEPVPGLERVTTALRTRSKIVRLNRNGSRGRGYPICFRCGMEARGGTEHTSPWGAPCSGYVRQVSLIDEMESDVTQLRFVGGGPLFDVESPAWHTLAAAIARTASVHLNIRFGDVQCGFRGQPEAHDLGELFLYDTVPGGAGYVQQIRDDLKEVLTRTAAALRTCENEDCRDEESCYTCLRSSENQYIWPLLQRSAGLAALVGLGV